MGINMMYTHMLGSMADLCAKQAIFCGCRVVYITPTLKVEDRENTTKHTSFLLPICALKKSHSKGCT